MSGIFNKGKECDIVVSSRIRLARNIEDYPYPSKIDAPSSKELTERIEKVFEKKGDYEITDFSSLPSEKRLSYAERHLVSPEFAKQKWPGVLISSEKDNVYIMVMEEDHLRIQSILPGLNLEKALDNALCAEKMIDEKLKIAYDEKLGYLTRCPTNLGTGMRASVMLFLPGMTYTGRIRALSSQLGKLGLTIRGMNGEGSDASGCLYQVSNQITLGISEKQTIEKLGGVVDNIIKDERKIRKELSASDNVKLFDRIMRSFGIARYAKMIDTEELFNLYSDIRLGISLGIISEDEIDTAKIDGMLFESLPATLICEDPSLKNSVNRDIARAKKVQTIFN